MGEEITRNQEKILNIVEERSIREINVIRKQNMSVELKTETS